MARWKRLESYLTNHDRKHTEFTVYEYADATSIDVGEATADIQSYLHAQRVRPRILKDGRAVGGSQTEYVLRRVPNTRTRNARWAVGVRKRDRAALGLALSSDTRMKALRAFQPDLLRLAQLNPRQAKAAERTITAVLDGAMLVLDQATQGVWDGDEDGDGS